MRKNNKFICVGFLLMIFSVLLCYPITYLLIRKNIISLDYSNFKEAPLKEGTSIITKLDNKIISLKTSIENRVTNYFPFYSSINYLYSDVNSFINQKIYDNYSFSYLGMNTDNEYVYQNNDFYILKSAINNNKLDDMFQKQLSFYEQLLDEDIKLYIYLPNRYEFTNLNSADITIRTKRNYIDKLLLKETDEFKIAELEINDNAEYAKYFYKTDHHWNSYGAYQGYKDIISMMNFEPLNLDITKTNIKYYGSIAKATAQNDIYDNFMYIDYNGDYDVKVNGFENTKYKPKVIKNSNNIYYDYYVSFYNGMFGEVCFDYNDDSKENLLIISDSYAWQIDEIIASHFNKTFVVNVRYDKFINGTLEYSNFIKENNITRVLVLEESATALFDMYNYGTSRKILGD